MLASDSRIVGAKSIYAGTFLLSLLMVGCNRDSSTNSADEGDTGSSAVASDQLDPSASENATIVANAELPESLSFTLDAEHEVSTSLLGSFLPQRIRLTPSPLEDLVTEPEYESVRPLYGTLPLGVGEDRMITVVVDEAGSGTSRIYVDLNNDEDLTNDGDGSWTQSNQRIRSLDGAKLTVDYDSGSIPHYINFYRYVARDQDALYYYRNSARVGSVVLGGRSYKVAISDDNADARFDDLRNGRLVIDLNGDGELDSRRDSAEIYRLSEPFNLHGSVWKIGAVSIDGTSVVVHPSNADVEMKLSLEPGTRAVDFHGTLLSGADFDLQQAASQSELVLIDFWASWCGPCRAEYPHLRRLHARYQDYGLKIVGVTLDRDRTAAERAAESQKLDYPHLFDGLGWQNAVAVKYRVRGIPETYLVDSDLNIVAKGLRGEALTQRISSILGEGNLAAAEAVEAAMNRDRRSIAKRSAPRNQVVPFDADVAADPNSKRWAAAGNGTITVFAGSQTEAELEIPSGKSLYRLGNASFGPDGSLFAMLSEDTVEIHQVDVEQQRLTRLFAWDGPRAVCMAVGTRLPWRSDDASATDIPVSEQATDQDSEPVIFLGCGDVEGAGTVFQLDSTGAVLGAVNLECTPYSIATTSEGLVAACPSNRQLVAIDHQGLVESRRFEQDLQNPIAIAVSPADGSIVVGDNATDLIGLLPSWEAENMVIATRLKEDVPSLQDVSVAATSDGRIVYGSTVPAGVYRIPRPWMNPGENPTISNDQGDRLTILEYDPPYPAQLAAGEKFSLRIGYQLTSGKYCRIWVRPLTDGSFTPKYVAHGSPSYERGEGETFGWFACSDDARVNQVQVKMRLPNAEPLILVANIDARWSGSPESPPTGESTKQVSLATVSASHPFLGRWRHEHPRGELILLAKRSSAGELTIQYEQQKYSYRPVIVESKAKENRVELRFKMVSIVDANDVSEHTMRYVLERSNAGWKGTLDESWSKLHEVVLRPAD